MAESLTTKSKTKNMLSTICGTFICGQDLVITTDIKYKKTLELHFYNKDEKLCEIIDLRPFRINSFVSSLTIHSYPDCYYSYDFYADGVKIADYYRRFTAGEKKWGALAEDKKSKIAGLDFEWGDDSRPQIKSSDVISYLMHVRGFTMSDNSISKEKRGTFAAVIDKIPYLKNLGINQIIFMPVYDFDEAMPIKKVPSNQSEAAKMACVKELPGINYWGYTKAAYYAPKNTYAKDEASFELKKLVKTLHENDIEVILQFYFPKEYNTSLISDVLKYWSVNYHVDGFHLLGENILAEAIANDSGLADLKIYLASHNAGFAHNNTSLKTCVSVYNYDFLVLARRLNKSDEDVLWGFVDQFKKISDGVHPINYITSNEGFTLNDLVSYDYKHNEDNLEDNKDGSDYNFSWNCGIEGPTRKKQINALRNRQIKNLMTMLLLAQGTPMLLQGDENLNSQGGNNNAYCQDNKTGYVDWKQNKDQKATFEFIKKLIEFRKIHPILHSECEMKMLDYKKCGYPDVSLHSEDAWRPKLSAPFRHVGLMYCGDYATDENGKADDFIYIAFNLHWEAHDFALPKLPKGYKWQLEIYTGDETEGSGIAEKLLESDDLVTVPYRSVAVLVSSKGNNEKI